MTHIVVQKFTVNDVPYEVDTPISVGDTFGQADIDGLMRAGFIAKVAPGFTKTATPAHFTPPSDEDAGEGAGFTEPTGDPEADRQAAEKAAADKEAEKARKKAERDAEKAAKAAAAKG